jgi:hypothetical protein
MEEPRCPWEAAGICEGYEAVILTTRNHNRGAGAFAFGKLPSGSHADLELLRFSADDWTVEIWLIEGVLDTAPPSASAVARLEVNAAATGFRHGARLDKGRGF